MNDRRATYFAYQGLLMAVLLLLFLYQYRGSEGWLDRLGFLLTALGATLLYLRLASLETLSRWWFQAGLFTLDAALASLILSWTQPQSDLYLIYFLIIYGTALTRNLAQSFLIALVTSLLYLFSAWHPGRPFPQDTGFWLRVVFLWTSSALLTILARDTQQARADQDRRFQGRLVEVERLATLGQVAGEVAHRIKGPLTTIMVNAEVLAHRHPRSKDMLAELGQIQEEVGRCKEILKSLLDLGRIEEIDFSLLDLREPVQFALKSIEPQARRLGLRVKAAGLESPLYVRGDHSMLQEAVAAVLQNAVDAAPRRGEVRVDIKRVKPVFAWPDRRGTLLLTVSDDGKGIAPGNLEKVFQPFFTTKGPQGSGLGLSAALRILQKHQGSIEAYSDGPGRGARFTLSLPESPAPARRRS